MVFHSVIHNNIATCYYVKVKVKGKGRQFV